jgi:hypothetical protein
MLQTVQISKIALASSVDIWLAAGMTVAAVGTALVIATGPPYRPEDAFGLVLRSSRRSGAVVAPNAAAGGHHGCAWPTPILRRPSARLCGCHGLWWCGRT